MRKSLRAALSSNNKTGFDHPDRRTSSPPTSDLAHPSPQPGSGVLRSQTVRRAGDTSSTASYSTSAQSLHSLHAANYPATISEIDPPHPSALRSDDASNSLSSNSPSPLLPMSAHAGGAPGKTSSDSGNTPAALDRWSQRRLQRLNTEQGFREQRQGGQSVLSPPATAHSHEHQPYIQQPGGLSHYGTSDAQPPQSLHQPQQQQQGAYQTSRSGSVTAPNVGLAIQTPSTSWNAPLKSPALQNPPPPHSHQQEYSPPENHSHYVADNTIRPALNPARSYSGQTDDSSSMSNNGSMTQTKSVRNGNRQSVHDMRPREGSHSTQAGQMAAFSAAVVPPGSQGQPYKGNGGQPQQVPPQQQQPEVGRATPQPLAVADEMNDDEVSQLVKDHKELREKYTKVKKYYFEKEDQVKQLQNSLAHQRLAQSRTSLDDSEYTTRFNRLDGLVAQLAFSIRKSWKSIPQWLVASMNKDAVATGKQEMTAAGRAFISNWLVSEVFQKYFHPDLEPSLSAQLRSIQANIRRHAPLAQSTEEEEYLTSKVVNWRLATLDGLAETLRSPQCPENRQRLTDSLKDGLVSALAQHLQDPPPSDLEGGVHMIIELVVSIAIHLPLESRDVNIEYFPPGYSILSDQMKIESGIPPLVTSVADDQADRASMKSAASDVTDMTDSNPDQSSVRREKRSMLSAITGGKPRSSKHAGASSGSLGRPESAQGVKEDLPPRVRMAAGISVSVRGRAILVKAPVFST
ncbi:uncharacterized protein RHO25_004304 [Cercospora beticola]|uniref:S-adenosylmethionine-dependent methyltransferase-like protein n=1 Tax=Cercospora beticola TaxID=122368 RepID=A0ABZ0NJI4_CERBT|nr:hypothetical protein RHO25_004304 [Cercospora beticola]